MTDAAADLEAYLDRWAGQDQARGAVAIAVVRLAEACRQISALVGRGPLAGSLGAPTGKQSGADPQKEIDVRANDLITMALKGAPVASLASEELEWPLPLNTGAPLAVAVDPIDGSSNIDADISVGTIFTVLPATAGGADASSFLSKGVVQKAAGFTVYGPYTSLVLTVGDGTHVFTLDKGSSRFILTRRGVQIPASTAEYSINSSNYRHWDDTIRTYADDILRGATGPRGKNFNMRWTASPVADIFRILSRGGVFLYPGDGREGYQLGRLRLVYEANPFAWIVEQAGGAASTGRERILDLLPQGIHERTPVILGSRSEVEYIEQLYANPMAEGERSPLFGRRGLFRT